MGMTTPLHISNELADFFRNIMCLKINRGDKLSRIEATRYLHSYIKAHNLQNLVDRRIIMVNKDPHLSALFIETDPIYFTLQKELAKHFPDHNPVYDECSSDTSSEDS